MSLSLTHDIARSSLATSGTAASVVSRNIANAGLTGASRKSVVLVTDSSGAVKARGIQAAVDAALFDRALESSAASKKANVVSTLLDEMHEIVGDPDAESSPAALTGKLKGALIAAAAAPNDQAAARTAILAAKDVTAALNGAARSVAEVGSGIEKSLKEAMAELAELADQFGAVNARVVIGERQGLDVGADIDQRNSLVLRMSELVEVRASARAGNDMMLFLADGTTLFETSARRIAYAEAGASGGAPRIDGVSLTTSSGTGGRIGGLLQMRDEVVPAFSAQLDAIARGLIVATAERNAGTPSGDPRQSGLFTFPSGPSLPAAGTAMAGLAAAIHVNANVDPAQGGQVSLLRDGAISNPADPNYGYNPSNAAGYSARLQELADALGLPQSFDPQAGLGTGMSVAAFASASAGWLENARSDAGGRLEQAEALAQRTTTAWQDRIGINIDDQMTELIALERSYQASSRLLTAVGDMFNALFRATE